MNKNDLRKKYISIRKSIQNKNKINSSIFNKVICDDNIINAEILLIYVSMNDEIDTLSIINYYINKKVIAVPRIDNNVMNFYIINSIKELKPGYYNILEPITNNKLIEFNNCVCIVPGICFDNNNYRIGYGKGFYDKFLYDKDIYTIGLTFKECLIDNIPTDKYDIALKKVIHE